MSTKLIEAIVPQHDLEFRIETVTILKVTEDDLVLLMATLYVAGLRRINIIPHRPTYDVRVWI